MKTIIAGSRTITDYSLVEGAIKKSGFQISEVVCGGAKGVDSLGKEWGNNNDIKVVDFPANWSDIKVEGAVVKQNSWGSYNARAGFDRNEKMAKYAEALVAVHDGDSAGTKDMITRSKKYGLKIYIYDDREAIQF